MSDSDTYRYDAFISYSHRDEKWVQGTLLPWLEDAGLHVCIDFRDFEPGAPVLTEMERAVKQSRKTLLVLTPDYLASEWAEFENILASTLDPAARQRRVIPLLLQQCELPLRIRSLIYLDFTQPSEVESQLQRLIEAIGGESIRPTPLLPTPPPAEQEQLPLVEIVTPSGQRIRGWLLKTLRDPVWQGIGGTVAVVGLLVAIGAWLWPDIRAAIGVPGPNAVGPTPIPALRPTPKSSPTIELTPTPIVCGTPHPTIRATISGLDVQAAFTITQFIDECAPGGECPSTQVRWQEVADGECIAVGEHETVNVRWDKPPDGDYSLWLLVYTPSSGGTNYPHPCSGEPNDIHQRCRIQFGKHEPYEIVAILADAQANQYLRDKDGARIKQPELVSLGGISEIDSLLVVCTQ